MKRVLIRKKIRRLLVRIAIWSMLAISVAALVLMLRIRHRSEGYILQNIESSVADSLDDIAAITELGMDIYSKDVMESANYIGELYKKASEYRRLDLGRHRHDEIDGFCYNLYFASKDYENEEAIAEAELLNNIEPIWQSFLMHDDDNISSFYLATEKGVFLGIDNEHIDILDATDIEYFNYFEREWYRKAKESGKLIFTKIAQDYFGRGLTLTCAAPFYDGEKLAGVVALDILVKDIQNNMIDIDAGEGSYAFAVDGDGDIIASPFVRIEQTTFDNIADEGSDTKQIAKEILSGVPGIELVGTSYYVHAPVNNVGWTICVKIPRTLITDSIKRIDRNIVNMVIIFIVVAVIMLVIVYQVSVSFSNRVTKPIEKLKSDVEVISKGNLDYKAEIVSNDEVSDLANSFNSMTTDLKNYIDNITSLTAERERNSVELNIATKIQVGMLPSDFPAFPRDNRLEIYATMSPAKEVGGDFYDFFKVDDRHLAIVVADVSGKGIPAALFMAIGMTLIRDHTFVQQDLSEVFRRVNNILCRENKENLFITAFEGLIDLETGVMKYVNAGHELPYICRKGKKWEAYDTKPGFVLGGMENLKYSVGEIQFEMGDRLFQYTDGVTEATNLNNELYGMERLKIALDRNTDKDVMELLPAIKKDIDVFVGEAPQFDDITMLGFEFK